MKPIIASLFILLAMLTESKAQVDTITIRIDTTCSSFMPTRVYHAVASKTGEGYGYMDSIRICGKMIDGFNKNYYLIVYDSSGTKRMEGNFFDEFANGHCINYDYKGRKTSEGDYQIKGKGRKRHSVQTGIWKHYNIKGELIREEKH